MHPILAGANVQQCADYCATHRASTSTANQSMEIWTREFNRRGWKFLRRFIGFFDVFWCWVVFIAACKILTSLRGMSHFVVVFLSDKFDLTVFSGDSGMYPYQRTPVGSLYISPI